MMATGTFTVSLQPLDAYAPAAEGAAQGRMSIDKTFSGDLTATSKGEMLTAMSPVKGSAGYVAIEKVAGSLAGKSGTFALQHYGTMRAGADSRLILEVVPDSGTGELAGLSGSMRIEQADGVHSYVLEYDL
ncbi:MAG: DUF3224 domain-containing protein [Saprospiraceae bacterium]